MDVSHLTLVPNSAFLIIKIHFQSITKENGLIVGWMDYPENANIIDPFEKQSDYYDRYILKCQLF
jgi:hypothetical protein